MEASKPTPNNVDTSAKVVGVVLAAGAGRRMGGPKALIGPLASAGRTPLARVCSWVQEAGCVRVIAVIGSEADAVRAALKRDPWPTAGSMDADSPELPDSAHDPARMTPATPVWGPHDDIVLDHAHAGLPRWLDVVEATDWADGMGASLRAGLRAASTTGADAVLITLVDLPDVRTPVYAHLLREARGASSPTTLLARASYVGEPGHPVLIGRHHWDAVAASAVGDRGARELFARTPHRLIECGHFATGRDADTPG